MLSSWASIATTLASKVAAERRLGARPDATVVEVWRELLVAWPSSGDPDRPDEPARSEPSGA